MSPFDEFERFASQLLPQGWFHPLRWERPLLPELHAPELDVIDRDGEVFVTAEIPGVKKEDLQISLAGNMLTIKGETRSEEKEEKGEYYRCEISRGLFSRSVLLPTAVDDSKAKAEIRDDMLEITLPKADGAKKGATSR
jgi:HSP20 family protein